MRENQTVRKLDFWKNKIPGATVGDALRSVQLRGEINYAALQT